VKSEREQYMLADRNKTINLRYFVVICEHPPNLCPHSNVIARKRFLERGNGLNERAKTVGIEIIFAGIPVPEHKIFMVLRAPNFETVRRLMVESGIVQMNTVKIYTTESFEEFAEEVKKSTPIF